MHKILENLLECPSCHGELKWVIQNENEKRIVNAEITCDSCQSKYHVKDEIAMFLTPDLVRNDLWQQVDHAVVTFFKEHENLLNQLGEKKPNDLNGADLWFLATYYEMQGHYDHAKELFDIAFPKVYSKEYLEIWHSHMDYIVNHIQDDEFVVDIASGKGYLVEKILRNTDNLMVATDFSPTVLLRNKAYYQHLGLYDNLSLVAFDARRTPFKDGSVPLLTTNVGLSNIENAGNTISELDRISKNRFMFYLEFIDENDQDHMALLEKYGMSDLNRKSYCLNHFKGSSFSVDIAYSKTILKEPTPEGEILEGVGIDGIPIHTVEFECCVLEGKK